MDDHVEDFKVFQSYNFDSFMAEIGGMMGVFLGWSFLFIVVTLLEFVKHERLRWWIEFAMTLVLALALIIWGWTTVDDYLNQNDSMEFSIKKGWSPPQITICPYLAFNVFGNDDMGSSIGQSCHTNDSDFFDTLKNCLKVDPNGTNEFYKDFQLPVEHRPKRIELKSSNRSFVLNAAEVMTEIWNEKLGLCYTLDGKKYWHR